MLRTGLGPRASGLGYFFDLASRLGYVEPAVAADLIGGYTRVIKALQGVVTALAESGSRGPRPEARGPR